jgi:hypothetical protein
MRRQNVTGPSTAESQRVITKSSSQVQTRVASLALAVVDLRAHFEAQLRAVARAEDALIKCRTATEPAVFEMSARTLSGEIQALSDNNRSVRAVIDQMAADARELVQPDQQQGES